MTVTGRFDGVVDAVFPDVFPPLNHLNDPPDMPPATSEYAAKPAAMADSAPGSPPTALSGPLDLGRAKSPHNSCSSESRLCVDLMRGGGVRMLLRCVLAGFVALALASCAGRGVAASATTGSSSQLTTASLNLAGSSSALGSLGALIASLHTCSSPSSRSPASTFGLTRATRKLRLYTFLFPSTRCLTSTSGSPSMGSSTNSLMTLCTRSESTSSADASRLVSNSPGMASDRSKVSVHLSLSLATSLGDGDGAASLSLGSPVSLNRIVSAVRSLERNPAGSTSDPEGDGDDDDGEDERARGSERRQ
mmetsp:Transcript_78/g.271  ORF Transcript_78/g.271 Transcript_78/m.271 type:complete len:306 (-) Transcript_78:98-1015(-)